jgi:hypothetical protein
MSNQSAQQKEEGMSHEANRWIITSHKFREHKSVDAALAELARIKRVAPNKNLRMVRIKRTAHDPACAIYQDNEAGTPRCNCPFGDYDDMIAGVAAEMAAS